ncbi:MAG: hypothetical protein AB7K09_23550 [Planctomycetota bacterium]
MLVMMRSRYRQVHRGATAQAQGQEEGQSARADRVVHLVQSPGGDPRRTRAATERERGQRASVALDVRQVPPLSFGRGYCEYNRVHRIAIGRIEDATILLHWRTTEVAILAAVLVGCLASSQGQAQSGPMPNPDHSGVIEVQVERLADWPDHHIFTVTVRAVGGGYETTIRLHKLAAAQYHLFVPAGEYDITAEPGRWWMPAQRVTVRDAEYTVVDWTRRVSVTWHVHHEDGSPWSNQLLGGHYRTDADGNLHGSRGPNVVPDHVVVIPTDQPTASVDLMFGDDRIVTRVNDGEPIELRYRSRGFEDSLYESFPTGLDDEGSGVLPALYARASVLSDRFPTDSPGRVQALFEAGFQLPLAVGVGAGGYAWRSDSGFERDNPFRTHPSYWHRRALDGARLSLAGNVGLLLADSSADQAGRPFSARLGLKWRLGDDDVAQYGGDGIELSCTVPFDALRVRRAENVDAIVDLSWAAGAYIPHLGGRIWTSIGRGFGPDAFTRFRVRVELAAFWFVSVGFDMQVRLHDRPALGSEEFYAILLGFGGIAYSPSVVLEVRLGGALGDAFRFGASFAFL